MEGFFTFNNLVLLGTYIVTGTSVYWRLKIDVANLNLKIEEMKEDRNKKWDEQAIKWACHDERQEKSDSKYDSLLSVMNEVKVEVGKINTTISFLKEK